MAEKVVDVHVHFLAGGLGGSLGVLLTCPLEVVKTRLQAANNKQTLTSFKHTGMFGLRTWTTIRDLKRTEGLLALWRGLGSNLVGVAPSRAIWFTTYAFTKQKLEKLFQKKSSTTNLLSAVSAGFTVCTVTAPIWLVKTRMQLQSTADGAQKLYKNSFDCVRRIFFEEGFFAFYKGLSASYIGIAESSLQLVLYEKMKQIRLDSKRGAVVNSFQVNNNPNLSSYEFLLLSSISKLIASALTYPHEVIRTRLREQISQHKYTGLWQATVLITREEGLAGLYGGMAPHLMRVVPNAAVMFLTYETVVSSFMADNK